jgi:hypothetical protein
VGFERVKNKPPDPGPERICGGGGRPAVVDGHENIPDQGAICNYLGAILKYLDRDYSSRSK